MTASKIQDLMLAAAPLADLLVMDFFAETKTWHIAADEETEIFGELDEARNVLVLSTPLGSPSVMDQQLLDLALRYGHVWDVTGGVRLSLEAADGPFWLVADVGVGGLDANRLAEALRNMVTKASAWRGIIQQPPRGEADEDELVLLSEAGIFRA
jgi:hypothetical protein